MQDWNPNSLAQADDESEADSIDDLRERMVQAVRDAIDKLANESTGRSGEQVNDRQLRACIALTRLAPLLLGARSRAEQDPAFQTPEYPRNMDHAEADRLLEELERGAADQSPGEAEPSTTWNPKEEGAI